MTEDAASASAPPAPALLTNDSYFERAAGFLWDWESMKRTYVSALCTRAIQPPGPGSIGL